MESSSGFDYYWVARRNDSLSARGQRIFFVSIFAVSLGIAAAWAWRGAWYVLPFAGLEMLVLFVALRVLARHAGDFESLSVESDRIVLVKRCRGQDRRYEFNRRWAQLLERGPGEAPGARFALRSHGKEVEFGAFLTDEQQVSVVRELRKRLARN